MEVQESMIDGRSRGGGVHNGLTRPSQGRETMLLIGSKWLTRPSQGRETMVLIGSKWRGVMRDAWYQRLLLLGDTCRNEHGSIYEALDQRGRQHEAGVLESKF